MPSRVKVGSFDVISLLDVAAKFPQTMPFPDVTSEQWAPYRDIYPHLHDGDMLNLSISCFAILGGGRTIMVDTGLGPVRPEMPAKLIDSLREEGIDPASVDTVIHTHMHGDHVGWNIQDGKRTFPNAMHVAPQADWDHFTKEGDAVVEAQIKPLHAEGKLQLVSGETQFTPEITLVPTPGHTPGHQSVVVSSGQERVFITGDLAHHHAQAHEMDWKCSFDVDAAQASATRKKVFDQLERDGTLAAFCHFTSPGFGMLVQDGGRRIFRPL